MSEYRKQMTQQSAASNAGVDGSAGEQGSATLVILPLYHPAAALYNGAMRATLKEDFKNIMTTINLIRKGN
jgi:uracil-DNA glycosylase